MKSTLAMTKIHFKNCSTCEFSRPLKDKQFNQAAGCYEASGPQQLICNHGVDGKGIPFKYIRYVHHMMVCGRWKCKLEPQESLCEFCKFDYADCTANIEVKLNKANKIWTVTKCDTFEPKSN